MNNIAIHYLSMYNNAIQYLCQIILSNIYVVDRDTTVQTLTLQPTVQDGVISYEDSPLVRAVKHGLILVVDEADKAPTNVTCILKTLVESGEMHLSDGRRIVSGKLRGIIRFYLSYFIYLVHSPMLEHCGFWTVLLSTPRQGIYK